jgi:NAD(P)-dependent dehydrogenase (short-subunit alcohol dehydrogenase family)
MDVKYMNNDNKSILITGATGNVGKAASTIFQAHSWDVARWSYSGKDNTTALNLASWYAPFYAGIRQSLPEVDMVLMAHGTQKPCLVQDMTDTLWYSIINNNLTSCVSLTSSLIKNKKLKDNALIVYCSSLQANTPRSGRGAYAAAKAGLEAFAKTVAVEVAPHARVVVLRLGQLTETMGGIVFGESEKKALQERALLSWVNPMEVAQLCYDLYGQNSMTGCVLDLDSGQGHQVW